MERLNFNHLFYFWTIAREGSIKKASQKLNLTPSGLSGQLKQLEVYFGKKLFDRKVRKLVLNDAGKIAFDYCAHIFGLSDELTRAVRRSPARQQVLIRVGVLPSLSATHIHDFLLPLWKNRAVSVTVVEGILDDLVFQLESGNLEIVLSDRPMTQKRTKISSYRLKPRKIIAVAAPRFAEARKNFPRSLSGLPMLHLTRHSQIRPEIDRYFDRHQVSPQIIGEADDATLLRLGAEKGFCFTVLPENTVQDAVAKRRLIKLGELKDVNSDMWAMARSDTDRAGLIKKTIEKFRSRR